METESTIAPTPPDVAPGASLEAHRRSVWRYLRLLGAGAAEADDMTQETFLRVLRHAPPRPGLLRVAARHVFLDARRADRRRPAAWSDAVDRYLAEEPDALADERLDALGHCLDRLPRRARSALTLRHGEGLSRREVAARLGLGINGLKALLHRVRNALRCCVEARLRRGDRET